MAFPIAAAVGAAGSILGGLLEPEPKGPRERTSEQEEMLKALIAQRMRQTSPFADLNGITFDQLSRMTGLNKMQNQFASIQRGLAQRAAKRNGGAMPSLGAMPSTGGTRINPRIATNPAGSINPFG